VKTSIKGKMKAKKFLLLFFLIAFLAASSNGGIIFRTQTRLFISELEQEIPDSDLSVLRPFVVIPNQLSDSLERQYFLRYFLNIKDSGLKQETKELKWEPQYQNSRAVFPRLVQAINIEGKKFEITLFPFGSDISLGFKILISVAESLTEASTKMLPDLQAIYDTASGGNILNTEINNFGYDFYVIFRAGKKAYIISFDTMPGIATSVR
jgi:hypothetical protein